MVKTIGAPPAVSLERMSAITFCAASTVSTNGTVWRRNRTPGKFASNAFPSVSAVMPVLSETKKASRVSAVAPSGRTGSVDTEGPRFGKGLEVSLGKKMVLICGQSGIRTVRFIVMAIVIVTEALDETAV